MATPAASRPPGGDDVHRFRHPLTRDAAYQLMPPSARARLHGEAAAILEAHTGAALDAASPEIAEHLDHVIRLSGGRTRAPRALLAREVAACERGAVWLERHYRHAAAVVLWERVASGGASGTPEQAKAWLAIANIRERQGRLDDCERFASRAAELAKRSPGAVSQSLQIGARRLAGVCAVRTGRVAAGRAVIAAALAEAKSAGDTEGIEDCTHSLATTDLFDDNVELAAATYASLVASARQRGDERRLTSAVAGHGAALLMQRRISEAIPLLLESLALAERAGSRRDEAQAFGNLAMASGVMDDDAGAFRYSERALAASRQSGDRAAECLALSNHATSVRNVGRLAEAEDLYRRAVALSRETGSLRSLAASLQNLGRLYLDHDRYEEAALHLASAVDTYQQLGAQAPACECEGLIADVHAKQGRHDEARRGFAAYFARMRDLRSTHELGAMHRRHAEFLAAAGDRSGAARALDEADACLTRDGDQAERGNVEALRAHLGSEI